MDPRCLETVAELARGLIINKIEGAFKKNDRVEYPILILGSATSLSFELDCGQQADELYSSIDRWVEDLWPDALSRMKEKSAVMGHTKLYWQLDEQHKFNDAANNDVDYISEKDCRDDSDRKILTFVRQSGASVKSFVFSFRLCFLFFDDDDQ